MLKDAKIELMKVESFDGQREDEEIVAVWRQHPFVLVKPALIIIGIIAFGSIPSAFFSPSWGVKFLLLFIAAAGIYGILSYYLWLSTLYILTNQRILAITQSSLFSRAINEVPLQNIQNVSHHKKGVFQMSFDFGTIEIQTAGAAVSMRIVNVSHPYFVQQKILAKEEER